MCRHDSPLSLPPSLPLLPPSRPSLSSDGNIRISTFTSAAERQSEGQRGLSGEVGAGQRRDGGGTQDRRTSQSPPAPSGGGGGDKVSGRISHVDIVPPGPCNTLWVHVELCCLALFIVSQLFTCVYLASLSLSLSLTHTHTHTHTPQMLLFHKKYTSKGTSCQHLTIITALSH